MIYTMLPVSAPLLILVLAVPRAARASRLARLFRAQEEWAEMMDRQRATPVGNRPAHGRPRRG